MFEAPSLPLKKKIIEWVFTNLTFFVQEKCWNICYSNTQSMLTFSKFRLWWAIRIIETICTQELEFFLNLILNEHWIPNNSILLLHTLLNIKAMLIVFILDCLHYYYNFSQINYGLNYIFVKPLQFQFQKCIDIYWFNILSSKVLHKTLW